MTKQVLSFSPKTSVIFDLTLFVFLHLGLCLSLTICFGIGTCADLSTLEPLLPLLSDSTSV